MVSSCLVDKVITFLLLSNLQRALDRCRKRETVHARLLGVVLDVDRSRFPISRSRFGC